MKSGTRLDSIIFQLTPTRTRCDLVISANGKTEKIASGLLNPFLAHLKAAQEQIGKGGYSIVLQPHHGSDIAWFTKGTVERFVRFVSTPEILERACTIESEILQIEKAISFQKSHDTGSHVLAEDFPVKSEESLEGSRPTPVGNEEKAIVLYQPVSHQSEEDGSTVPQKNSKVQLVQVLETRKIVLQKEQGMAFARAAAASFDIDNIAALLAFAECFGASRMMDACNKFMHLWKAKHESGQWVEVETADALSYRADLPSTNAAGIVFHSPNGHKEFKDSLAQGDSASEKNGLPDKQEQPFPQEYSPGQFPHPMFAPWQMHPQASGLPAFQPYPMQGMPYYQNYRGSNPYFQPPYAPQDDARLHSGQKTRQRRHSMDSRDLSFESEGQETDTPGRKMEDDVKTDDEDSVSRRQRNKGGKSSRKQSGTVVIRNINYIASAKQGSGDSDPQSCSDSGTDDETRKSRKKGGYQMSDDPLKSSLKEERMSAQAGDDGHWKAFQNFLLTDADESSISKRSDMYAMEGKVQGKYRQNAVADASSALGRRNMGGKEDTFSEQLDISRDSTCVRKRMDDQMLSYGQEANLRYDSIDGQVDPRFSETGNRTHAYRRPADRNMDYMINRQEKLTDLWDSSLDPVISNGFQGSNNNSGRESHAMPDESLVVLHRTGSLDQVADDGRTAMDMDYQLPAALQKTDSNPVGTTSYEPNDLSLMPNRVVEGGQSGYDPAMDYEMQAQAKETAKHHNREQVTPDTKEGPGKSIKVQKLKAERRNAGGTRREKPSKLSPSEDARARAEKLRAFKADLQKLKKEKEEEQLKRLEALKMQRQKRIAARSGATLPLSPSPSQQPWKQPPKLSPGSQKTSKFSDVEPGSSSPLQRSTLKNVSKLLSDSSKVYKSGRATSGSQTSGNRLTRSASSLSMRKEENISLTPDLKAATDRIRRLSEPKSGVHPAAIGKTRSADVVSRRRLPERPEMKKMTVAVKSDKPKSLALPEEKLRASKGSVSIQKKTTNKEMAESSRNTMLSNASITNLSRGMSHPPREDDDNIVVEKTVVMLEYEKPASTVPHAAENKRSVHNMQTDANNDPGGRQEEDLAVPPPASPIVVKEVDCKPCGPEVKVQSSACKNEAEEVSANLHYDHATGKQYQAPHARVSSLEDPCMAESRYGKAPLTSLDTTSAGVQTNKVLVSDSLRKDSVEMSEAAPRKSLGKEPAKGFKRLLKFGKKSSSASESNIEFDSTGLDGPVASDAVNGSSGEAFKLKNLLSQEESSSANTTPKKSSRSFSLFSPFKSKVTDKKSTA